MTGRREARAMNKFSRTVLCIDAEGDPWNLRSGLLAALDLRADIARSPGEALLLLRNRKYAAVLIGCCPPNIAGPALCRDLRTFDERTPVIVFGDDDTPHTSNEALAAGANAYLPRHENPTTLIHLLATLITQNETDIQTNYKKASGSEN